MENREQSLEVVRKKAFWSLILISTDLFFDPQKFEIRSPAIWSPVNGQQNPPERERLPLANKKLKHVDASPKV